MSENTSKKIVFIASNPVVSEMTGWTIGFWLSELAHPWWEFSKQGYQLELASPNGGEIVWDGISDPENARPGTPPDFVSLGFKTHPVLLERLKQTKPLSEIRVEDYDAIFLIGGLGPMYTFIGNEALHQLFVQFYEADKVAAAICHGTCVLLRVRLSDGKLLADGKRWTGFSNAEEDAVDAGAGRQVEPFRIENEATKLPTHYESGPAYKPFAIADGKLVTGQQGNSGAATARLVIDLLEGIHE